MSEKKQVGYGVLGLGIGKAHIMGAINAKGCKFVAICDHDKKKLDEVGEHFGIDSCNRFTSFDEMLKRTDIDIVSICTPSGMHRNHAVQALRAGKHVLVEKPIEISLDKIDDILSVAQEEEKYVGCIFQNRLSPGNQKIKVTIENGRLGKLITSNFHVKWYRTDEYYSNDGNWRGTWEMDGGGAIMNQSVHTVDLMQWMMGPVKSVFAKTGVFNHNIETEDTAVAVITFENGAIGTLIGTTCAYPGLEVLVQIHGEKGSIYAENSNIKLFKMADDLGGEEEKEVLAEYGGMENKSGSADPMAISMTGHNGQIQDMITSIINNRPPSIQGKDGYPAVEIILAIYESAKSGKEVFLPLSKK